MPLPAATAATMAIARRKILVDFAHLVYTARARFGLPPPGAGTPSRRLQDDMAVNGGVDPTSTAMVATAGGSGGGTDDINDNNNDDDDDLVTIVEGPSDGDVRDPALDKEEADPSPPLAAELHAWGAVPAAWLTWAAAQQLWEQALALKPDDWVANFMLGKALQKQAAPAAVVLPLYQRATQLVQSDRVHRGLALLVRVWLVG